MSKDTIYIRTERGKRALGDSGELAPGLDKILAAIDGTSSVAAIRTRLDRVSAGLFDVGLEVLMESELIRDVSSAERDATFTSGDEPARKAQELRDKIRDRRKGGDRSRTTPAIDAWYKARREAEAQAAQEAEEAARHSGDEKAKRAEAEMARRVLDEQNKRIAADHARRAAEEQAKRAIEELAKREAEDKTRLEAEEQARHAAEEQATRAIKELAKRESLDKARREAEEQARRMAEEEARRREAERVRLEAEEKARREAERAKQEAEEAARRAAEESARAAAASDEQREAADRARQDADAEVRRAAEDEARREVERLREEEEAKARMAVEEQAWREAEEKFRRDETEAGEEARKRSAAKAAKPGSTKPRKLGLMIAVGLLGLVVVALVAAHLISYDGQIPQFEKAAAAQFQQPVKIKALRLSLLPSVKLRLEDVSVGAEGQIKVPRITATGGLGNLFSEKKTFSSVEIDSPVLTEAGLGWILFGKSAARDVAVGKVSVSNARLESKNLSLPAFGAKFQLEGDGTWKAIAIESVDKNLNVDLTPKGDAVQFDFKARAFKLPFGSELTLDDLVASGTASKAELAVNEFKGFAYGGILGGNAVLKWGTQWSLAGELNAKQMDMARLVPGLMEGRLAGTGAYAMQAPEAARLFAANRLEGNFAVARGTLMGVDLGRMVQGGAMGGETKFAELAGGLVHDRGVTQLRQVRLTEGAITANGGAEIDAENNVRGRFAVDLRMSAEQRRANLVVAGSVKKIEWRRP